jgi:predicted aspartyl protease
MSNYKICFLIMVLAVTSTQVRGTDKPDEISFKLVQGFGIVIRGEIGATRDMNFLLDTGAVPSVLSQRAAARMGVRGVMGSLTVLNQESQSEYVNVDEVRLGWIHAAHLPMMVVELAHLEQRLGTRIDAIVGLDFFAGQDISIDYSHRKITRGLSGQARHAIPVEVYSVGGAPYWVLPVSLDGKALRLLLDTGANDLGLFAPHAKRTFKLVSSESIAHSSAAGEGKAMVLPSMTLVMSDGKFKNQMAVVLGEPPDALLEIDGVLGPMALGITRIELDWGQKCLRWDTR